MAIFKNMTPRKRAALRKWGAYALIPLGAGVVYAFVWHDIKTVVLSPSIALEDRMAATEPPTDATTIEGQGIVASAEVQDLWAKLDKAGKGSATNPALSSSPAAMPSEDAVSSTPATHGEAEGAIPASEAPQERPALGSGAPVASNDSPGASTGPTGASSGRQDLSRELTPEEKVRAALSEEALSETAQGGSNAQPIPTEDVARAQRNFNAMLGRPTQTQGGPQAVVPARQQTTASGVPSTINEDVYKIAASKSSGAATIIASAPVAGKNQLKEGTTIMAVLKNRLIVGNRPHSADFFTLGATNNLSNVPPGMTMTGMAEMSVDRKRVYITIDKCGSDDKAAPSLPCSAVVRDPSGADGLEGYYFNPRKWERLWNIIAGYLSAPTFTNLTAAIETAGKSQLTSADASSLQSTMKDAFQKAADTLRDSLPSDEIRIQAGVIVEIRVTKSVQLW